MKRSLSRSESNRAERMPSSRLYNSLSPWTDEFWEPTRWFDEFFNRNLPSLSYDMESLPPAIDIDETENSYVVNADLPGVRREDISIECHNNQLSISAERKYESGQEERKQGRRERFQGKYFRSFTLPTGVNADEIHASYEDGVLTVEIPKGEESKAKRIEIGEGRLASSKEGEPGRGRKSNQEERSPRH